MAIQQVTVFIENRAGRLAEVTRLLSAKGINIRALSLADTSDFGLLRLIVNTPEDCVTALKEAGLIARATEVIALGIDDSPGGLDRILALFADNNVNVEYMYAFVEKAAGKAIVVFKTENNAKIEELAKQKGVPVFAGDDLEKL